MKIPRWLVIMGVAGLLAGGLVWSLLNAPMAPGLALTSEAEQLPETEVESDVAAAIETEDTSETAAALAPTATPENIGSCGQRGKMTLLLIGEALIEDPYIAYDGRIIQPDDVTSASPDHHYAWFGAGAIRLLQVDFDTKSVRNLPLPPELWVDTAHLAEAQATLTTTTPVTEATIDLVYYYAKFLEEGTEREQMIRATSFLAQNLVDNFEFVPDHYVTIKQEIFADMVDAIGGLEINIPEDVDAYHFSAGQQTLTGSQTVTYTRLFQGGEAARIQRQNLVLESLMAQLMEPATMAKFPQLISQFSQDVVTDLSMAQATSLGCILKDPQTEITYLEIDPELIPEGPDCIRCPKMEELLEFLKTEFNY